MLDKNWGKGDSLSNLEIEIEISETLINYKVVKEKGGGGGAREIVGDNDNNNW